MAWFFTDNEITSDIYRVDGENAKHLRVLRVRTGEAVTLVTPAASMTFFASYMLPDAPCRAK